MICANCHRKTAKWISFRRLNASSGIIHAHYLCEKCGFISRWKATDSEIENGTWLEARIQPAQIRPAPPNEETI